MSKIIVTTLLLTSLAGSMSWAEPVLNIATFNNYPYHYSKSGIVKGEAVEILDCIMSALSRKFTLTAYPRTRAIQLAKSGMLDGLLSFQSSGTEYLKSVASNPIVFERWNIYYSSGLKNNSRTNWKSILDVSRLGSVRGGSIDAWLLNRNFHPNHRVSGFDQLLKMLYQKRIDAFLADERSTESTISEVFRGHDFLFEKKFVTFSPISIHFNKNNFSNSGFIDNFNSQIYSCRPKPIELKHYEREFILEKSRAIFSEIISSNTIIEKVLKSNSIFPNNIKEYEIDKLEKKWNNQKSGGEGFLVKSVTQSKESEILRQALNSTEGVVLEIIVMNKHGFNIASTGITSDYYQGDEEKYGSTYQTGSNAIHQSDVTFDDSTNSFGAQVSFTLNNNGVKIGAVTFTIDVYRAFQLEGLEALD